MVGRQTPFLALVIPFILVVITEGRSGLRRSWVVALTAGLSFAVCQSALSTSVSPQLVDMLAALIATACTMTVLRLRRASLHAPAPAGAVPVTATGPATSGVAVASADPAATVTADSVTERARAFAPYVLVMLVVAAAQLPALQSLWDATTTKFSWPGLHVLANSGKAVTATNASFTWLNNPGSLALIAGVLCAPVLGLGPVRAGVTYLKTLHQLRWAIFTVCCVVGLSYVMNLSGQTITLGVWLAGAGVLFPFVSPLIGWLGTALTGSDTSTNTLFGTLQVTTAHSTGLSATLLAAANSSGGVMGKAISPQNLTIAAVAVGMAGNESILFRRVVGWTALLAGLLALLVFLQSTPVLSWLVP
jgi:lactate permease